MLARLVILTQLVFLVMGQENIEDRVTNLVVHLSRNYPTPLLRLRDDFIAFPDIGSAYKYFDSKRTWDSARETCLEYNSTLAIIDSWKKIDHVLSIRTNDRHAQYYNNVATGVHRPSNSGEWVSAATGLPVTSLPWVPRMINYSDRPGCVVINSDGSGLSFGDIGSFAPFVCEIPLPID